MDSLLQFPSSTLFISILSLLLCVLIHYLRKLLASYSKNTCNAPQASGALPIIGHLHLLGDQKLIHETLNAMADKYGPTFTIRVGSQRVLVVSNCEVSRECFTTHDKAFSTRPTGAASELLGYNNAMFGFAAYSSYWRELRKIVTIELLSNQRLDQLKHIRASELKIAIKDLHSKWESEGCPESGVLVDIKKWLGDLSLNIVLRMVVGRRYFGEDLMDGEAEYCREVIREFIELFGEFVISDAIPILKWFDINGHKEHMKDTAKKLDKLVEGWLEEHKQRRLLGELREEERDFMDVLLTILQDANVSCFDADTINKATCLNLIAGSDSINAALIWTLSLLLNNPHVLKKVQEELDIHIGKDSQVKESDIKNLVYLQAVVKETFRLHPPSPVIALRAAMEDCTLSTGYYIPAGTRLLVNIWRIQRDENLWPDPHTFKPERFLTSHKDIDVRGQHFELFPFGSGRRQCPGISLTLNVQLLTLATLLHSFDIAIPSNESMDVTQSTCLSTVKATPPRVLLTPRLKGYEL